MSTAVLPRKIQFPVNSTAIPPGTYLFKIHTDSITGLKDLHEDAAIQRDKCKNSQSAQSLLLYFHPEAVRLLLATTNRCFMASGLVPHQLHASIIAH